MSKKNMFPAPAGMSPFITSSSSERLDVPRTRGDEPQNPHLGTLQAQCSPHPRG